MEYLNSVDDKNSLSYKIIEHFINNNVNYNLILAGHSLGGRIKIPFIGGIINDKGANQYNKDYYKLKNSDLYISSGIGSNIYPYRFLNSPSINLYRLRDK